MSRPLTTCNDAKAEVAHCRCLAIRTLSLPVSGADGVDAAECTLNSCNRLAWSSIDFHCLASRLIVCILHLASCEWLGWWWSLLVSLDGDGWIAVGDITEIFQDLLYSISCKLFETDHILVGANNTCRCLLFTSIHCIVYIAVYLFIIFCAIWSYDHKIEQMLLYYCVGVCV